MTQPADPTLPTADDIPAAAERIAPYVRQTPLLTSPQLDERTGARVFLKAGHSTPLLQYRGALEAPDAGRRRSSLGWWPGLPGIRASGSRCRPTRHSRHRGDAACPAIKLRHTAYHGRASSPSIGSGKTEVSPSALPKQRGFPSCLLRRPFVIAGQGTAARMRSQLAALDLRADRLLVCTGGGGLMAGCALAFEGTGTRLHTVEPEGFEDHAESFRAGRRVQARQSPASDCDALLTPTPGSLTFAINQPRVASGLVVTQAEVHEAMRFAFEHLALVLEPGGAVCLAALLAKAVPVTGRR